MLSVRKKMFLADASLLFAAAIWGLFFIAAKGVMEALPPVWTVFFRFGPSCLVLALLFPGRMPGFTARELHGALTVGFWTFLGVVAQMTALGLSTAGNTAFITGAYVIFTPLIPWLFRGRFPGRGALISSGLCFAGIGMLAGAGGTWPPNAGDALSLLGAVFFALQLLALERYAQSCDSIRLTVGIFAVIGVLTLALALAAEGIPRFEELVAAHGTRWLWGAAYSVLAATVFAMTLQTVAQRYTRSTHAAIACSAQGIFGALFGVLLLGEPCTADLIAGGALITAAVAVAELTPGT